MVCQRCEDMLQKHAGRRGTLSALALDFSHHNKAEDLKKSVMEKCALCHVVWQKAESVRTQKPDEKQVKKTRVKVSTRLSLVLPGLIPETTQLYRLDFMVEGIPGFVASFILEEIQEKAFHQEEARRTATTTDGILSEPDFDLARSWIRDCHENHEECKRPDEQGLNRTRSADDLRKTRIGRNLRRTSSVKSLGITKTIPVRGKESKFYPTRLLDLQDALNSREKALNLRNERKLSQRQIQRTNTWATAEDDRYAEQRKRLKDNWFSRTVRLVSKKPDEWRHGPEVFTGEYVTLSHCWGKAPFTKLTDETLKSFQNGVPIGKLPKSFQDAVEFACALMDFGVRWLWIDALCIIQEDAEDWLAESKQMHEVYTNSFCNISATAASDSSKGLFYTRETKPSWVDTVTLYTKDLKDDAGGRVKCIIHDLSFWRDTVENAPVNRRSWVFQERLLAPRVVHWCKDQIAFECRKSDRAESRPDGLRHFQMQDRHVIEDTRLKSIDMETGKKLRDLRLKSKEASFIPSGRNIPIPRIYLYEIWRRHVELYSKMELSFKEDRLVALSGIARWMENVLRNNGFVKEEYVAGMWAQHMASQLLWYVKDAEGPEKKPVEDTRLKEYRAPTFSWASVETGRGVAFPETTDSKGLHITVEAIRLLYQKKGKTYDMYGRLTDGYLVLRGLLRKVELIDLESSWRVIIRRTNWLMIVGATCGAVIVPMIVGVLLCAVYEFQQPGAIMASWASFCVFSAVMFSVEKAWIIYTTPVHSSFRARREYVVRENRFRWRVIRDGNRGKFGHEDVWLDSPASSPSIFGKGGNVFCLPVATESDGLMCLLLQAIIDGEYGVRYQRIGLTKVALRKFENILRAPGQNVVAEGKYYYGTEGKTTGDSTICII